MLSYIKSPRNGSICYFSSKLDFPSNVLQNKTVARIMFFKIRPSQEILKIRDEILKIRDGTPLENKRVAQILFFKIRPSQEILKIRDGTPLEAENILTYIKALEMDRPSQEILKIRDGVARILFFKIRPSQEILKIRDGTPLEAENILTYIKALEMDRPSQEILKIRDGPSEPSQEILKIRDGPSESEEILPYIKSPRNGSICYFSIKLDVPSNVVQKKRVARIHFFKIRPSQEILKIRDGTPLEAEEILTYIKKPSKRIVEMLSYIKSPRNGSICYFSSKLDFPSNVLQNKTVARILFFKIRPSQEILKIRDGTPLEAEEILPYIKKPSKWIVARILFFIIRPSQEILKIRDGTPLELDVPNNVLQNKRVARVLFFKIRPSQEILKIRDGTPLEAENILTYIKGPRNGSVCYFSSKLDIPSNVVQKKRVAQIHFFKIRPSQEILKIRDGTTFEEEILTYIKNPRNGSICYFSSKLDISSNVVHKKRVAQILFFKIRPSQEILKIRNGTPFEAEEILTYIKSPRNRSICYFSSKLDVSSNVVQKKRVARILFFKIRPSQEILKIRDGTPFEAEEILTYIKSPRNRSVCYFSSNDVPSNVVQTKRVARILFFKIRPSQEILKIRDGTPLEAEKILTYIKNPRMGSICKFYSKLDVPNNVVQKKRVARILFFKIRPSQEILKIRDGTPLEAEEILTYIKKPSKRIEILKIRDGTPLENKRVAQILFFKIRPSQEILKIRDGTPLEAENILTYIKALEMDRPSQEILKIRDGPSEPSQEILKIRDGPSESEEILPYIKSPRNGSICYFSIKLDVPSNVVQKKRVAQIHFFKIRPSQEILKIRDGTPLEAEEILTYIKKPSKWIVEMLSYIKSPRNGSICYFSSKLDFPSNVLQNKTVARILFFKIRPSQEILKIRDGTHLEKRVARILFFRIRPSQEILKIRDGTPLENKRVARVLFFKIRPSQEILKIRDGTPLEAENILTYIKGPRNGSVCYFSSKLDIPSNVVQKKRVAQIHFFKIRPSQEILKIRDGTTFEEEILTYIKNPRNGSICYFSSKLDISSNVVHKKRVAQILFFKIRPSQEILKIRNGTPFEAEEILTYIKSPRNRSICYFSSKLDVSSNVVQKKRVARILFFKIRPSQEILKIRDGTPFEAEEILTYIKSPRNRSVCYFSSNDVPSNVVQTKRVARILFFKIRPSQEILKIRDGTPLEAEKILTYIKNPRMGSICKFYSKLDVPNNVVQKKRVARILFFKIRPSQEILKIRDGTPLEAEEILTYIKKPSKRIEILKIRDEILKIRDGTPLENKRVAQILFFKIRPSQEILKIRDGTPLEAENILTYIKALEMDRPSQEILKIRDGPSESEEILPYIKSPRNGSICYFSIKLDVPSNVVQKKRVAQIHFFKIRPSQEILKIRDGTPLEAEEILTYIKKPSKRIVEMLSYIKSPRNGSICYFSSKLDFPSNVLQNKTVARILFFKIRPSQEILKIRDGTPLEAEEFLPYIKKPSKWIEILKIRDGTPLENKRVARVLFFKIRPSQEILKIRDGTPLEAENILTYIKGPRNGSVCYFSSKLDIPSNVVQKKRVAQIHFFKIRPSQEILKIRDGTTFEEEEILTYIKNPRNGSICYFSSKLDISSNVVHKKRVAQILFFKIRPSQEILKIRNGTPFEAEEILTYIKSPRNRSICYFSSKLDVSSNVVQKKRVARILFFKIRPSQEILKIRDGTPFEAEEILTYIKSPRNRSVCYFSSNNVVQTKRVARILFFKIRPSQEILKIRDGTPLEAEKILTYIKNPRMGSICKFYSKLDVPNNVVQKKRVARILFFKIRPSQEILKIRDGTPLEAEEILTYIKKPSKRIVNKRVAQILFFKIRPSQEILKIRDGTPLEAENILTYIKALEMDRPSQEILKIRDGPSESEEILPYIKSPRNGSICYFSIKLDVPSNVVQKKRVAQIHFFKIRPSQEILKIRDGTPLEAEEILTYIKKPSKRIVEMLSYIKSPRNGSICYFSSKLDFPSNVLQNKTVARILFFKIRPSQEILKIRDGTPLEKRVARILFFRIRPSQEILKIRDGTPLENKRVARVLFFKIRPSQEILKIRDGTPLEAENILTYIKGPRNGSVCYFSSKLDIPSNVVQKKRVAQIHFFKIRPSQEILKIRDGTTFEEEEILTYIKNPRNGSICYFSSKLDISSNVVHKKRVAQILFFKIRPSQEILKIRNGTPFEAEEILTYIKSPRNRSICYFSSKLDVSSNVVQKKRVARILFFKIRPSQEILKIRDGTPFEAEEILTYIKSPRNRSVCYFSSKNVPSNVVQTKRVARILFFKIRPSQEILKIRDGTPLEAEKILTYIKNPRMGSICKFYSKLDVPNNVVQKKRVARILFFKIRPSQEILKIRDGTPLEAEEILTYIKKPSKRIGLLLF
ncbi:hypothetical protein OROHE_011363 [Orobanche hederae]